MPTAYEQVRDDNPGVAAEIDALSEALATRLWLPPRLSRLEEAGVPQDVAEAASDREGPPGGIFGVGAVSREDGSLFAGVFVIPALASGVLDPGAVIDAPVHATPAAAALTLYGASYGPTVRVIGLPIPREHEAVVTNKLWSRGRTGTCGVEVRMKDASRAVLTAGHVVQDLDAEVFQGDAPIGVVASTSYLGMYGADDAIADVGIIRLTGDMQVVNQRGECHQGAGKTQSPVVVDSATGPKAGFIRGVVESFALKVGKACWRDVAITDRALSAPGDSGAPVYLDTKPDSFIGHVVAGDERAYTLIQDASCILQAADVTLT